MKHTVCKSLVKPKWNRYMLIMLMLIYANVNSNLLHFFMKPKINSYFAHELCNWKDNKTKKTMTSYMKRIR